MGMQEIFFVCFNFVSWDFTDSLVKYTNFLVTSLEFSMYNIERLLLNLERRQDSWPPEEKNSIQGQRRGLITQSFCVIDFY